MKISSKRMLNTIVVIIFFISFIGMVFNGYITFYIEMEVINSKDYSNHFAIVSEEIDSE